MGNWIAITLTTADVARCREQAQLVMDESAKARLNPAKTYDRPEEEILGDNLKGACAETAFCKWQRIAYNPHVNIYHHKPDVIHQIDGVGRYHEIRGTHYESGHLPVRSNDPNEYRGEPRVYTLVTGAPPYLTMTIRGWIRGKEAKQDRFVWNPHGHRQSWGVPQSALHSYGAGPAGGVYQRPPAAPEGLCHRWLDGEFRWCGGQPIGVWQIGPLCEEHAPEDRSRMITSPLGGPSAV